MLAPTKFCKFLDSVSNRKMNELVCYGIQFISVDEIYMEYCAIVGEVWKAIPHKYDIYWMQSLLIETWGFRILFSALRHNCNYCYLRQNSLLKLWKCFLYTHQCGLLYTARTKRLLFALLERNHYVT